MTARNLHLRSAVLALGVVATLSAAGAAMMVYTFFPKPLGPLLAAVEIGFFVRSPLMTELTAWKPRLPALFGTRRARLMASMLLVVLALVPWFPGTFG